MADFPKINAPKGPDGFNYSDIFDTGQIDAAIVGINRGKDGALQALTDAQESLGLLPKGSTEFQTQEAKKEQEVLRESQSDDLRLDGAEVSEFIGESLPLFAITAGTGPLSVAAISGAASSIRFQDDPANESRLLETGLGTGAGFLFGKLLSGGRAKVAASEEVERLSVLSQRTGLRAQGARGPAQSTRSGIQGSPNPALAREQPGFFGPRTPTQGERLRGQGLSADDFQNAGRNPIPGFSGIPKPRIRVPLSPARKALADARANALRSTPKEVKTALRKLEVMRANAARKVAGLKGLVSKAKKAGAKPHIVVKLSERLVRATNEKTATSVMAKSIAAHKAIQEAGGSIKPTFPTSAKPNLKLKSSAVADAATPVTLTRKEAIKRILQEDPGAKGLSKMKVAELNDKVNRLGPAPASTRTLGGKQSGFINTDAQALGSGAVAGGLGTATQTDDPFAIGIGAVAGAFGLRTFSRRSGKSPITHARQAKLRAMSKDAGRFTADVSRLTKARDNSAEAISSVFTNAPRVLDSFMGSTMTRLEKLSPRLATALKEAEFLQHFKSGQWLKRGGVLMERIRAAKLSDTEARTYKISLLNSTENAKKYLNKIGKPDAANAVGELQQIADEMAVYLGEVGLGAGLRKNYFPRLIKDLKHFENIPEVRNFLQQVAAKKKVSLSDFDKENAITDAINGAMIHRSGGAGFARASGNLQRRMVKVDSKNVDAYADPHEAINEMIESVSQQVERRRFFQGLGVKVDDLGPNAENIDSVAARLKDSLKKRDMDEDQLDEAVTLIRMRFGPGEQAPSKFVQNFKNLTYTGLLANPMSAMTQFGDLALSAHRNGIRNTVRGLMEELSGRGKITGVDKETLLGIRNAAADFASKTGSRDLLNWGLKYSGFQAADKLGKNTFIKAAMHKNKQMSKEDFFTKWKGIFDPDAAPGAPATRTEGLWDKVQRFEKIDDNNKEDLGFMLWNDLSGAQPIALSALPEQYLKNPNGRMLYMLQSFTLKLFDVMRKDVVQLARDGNKMQAAKNATKLTSLFVAMNGTVDGAKNFILGRDETPAEIVLNNFMKMSGFNRYTLTQVEREGFGSTIAKTILPPTALGDAIGDGKKALGLAPIVGRNLASDRFQQ